MREHGVTDAAGEAGTSEGNHLVAFNVMFNQDLGPERFGCCGVGIGEGTPRYQTGP